MIGIAIVGVGSWGRNLLREFNAIAEIPACCIAGSRLTSKWISTHYPRVEITKDYEEILANPRVDAVAIATPVETQFRLAIAALSARKHVFVEKPMATKVQDAARLREVAEEKGVKLFVGYQFLYHEIYSRLERILASERPRLAHFVWNKFGSFKEDIVWNLLCHDVAISVGLFGMPIHAIKIYHVGVFTKADIFAVELEFDDGMKSVLEENRVSRRRSKVVTVVTEKNTYVWETDRLYRLDKEQRSYTLAYRSRVPSLTTECKSFIQAVEKSKPYVTDGTFGMNVTKVLAAISKK